MSGNLYFTNACTFTFHISLNFCDCISRVLHVLNAKSFNFFYVIPTGIMHMLKINQFIVATILLNNFVFTYVEYMERRLITFFCLFYFLFRIK